jgi:homospermidine synthase
MMKQIADLTAVQNRNTERNNTAILQMEYKQHQDKQDTPTTPTEMTNSPSRIQKPKKPTLLHKICLKLFRNQSTAHQPDLAAWQQLVKLPREKQGIHQDANTQQLQPPTPKGRLGAAKTNSSRNLFSNHCSPNNQ